MEKIVEPWIENVSLANIIKGHHFDPGSNSMLIQIVDPGTEFPIHGFKNFKEVHQFKFFDIEPEMFVNPVTGQQVPASGMMNDEQAKEIAALLKKALDNHMNVIVHCHAGICRSGAVAECGVQLGFKDTEVFRLPNIWVKNLIIKHLG